MKKQKEDDSKYLDPVFLKYGMKVYRYEYIQMLRKENLDRKRDGKKIYNMIPQAGFQERVLTTDVDVKVVGGKRGSGKAVSVDSQILTPFGFRRYGDLQIGDIVTDPITGGMERVIAIYEHPQKDLYRVTFDDGSTCECCEDHLWKVRQTGYAHKRRMLYGGSIEDDYRIWTFGMIKEWLDKQKEGHYIDRKTKSISNKYLIIPMTAPVKFTKSGRYMKLNDLDPYVIGVLLGDGCITDSIMKGYDGSFCGNDPEIAEIIKNTGVNICYQSTKNKTETVTYYFRDTKVREMLDKTHLSGCSSINKFIPTCYKYASIEDRYAILQGLMDTDGTCDNNGGSVSFCSISKRLAEDVQFVVRSLGGYAKITTKKPFYRDKEGNKVECNIAYNVYIKIKDTSKLFRLKRKKDRCKPFNGGVSEIARRIVSYEYVGKKDARCITVDSPNSLYAIQDFIVTHNTWIGLYEFMPYIFNQDVSGYGFRKFEDDISRGIWRSSKQVFKGFGSSADSLFEWKFLAGKGATFKCEHLQDPKKISDRFRGAELAYILIEELAEHTRDNMATLFDLLASNRSTAGVKPKCVCTCNPVGRSNKLRYFLDWYIDPDTDTIIPERDGKVRFFYRYGEDVTEIAWGDSWEEVYEQEAVKTRIDALCTQTGQEPREFITSFAFIEGGFQDNLILQAADPKYMNRIAARGGESTTNDIVGVWRDVETSSSLLTIADIDNFYNNVEQRDGTMRASCDVALAGDFFVIYALDGHHIQDMEAWRGMMSDDVVPFIENFLERNGVRKENFTYDSNGLGVWLKADSRFARSVPFNNKAASTDPRQWKNLKSEAAEKFVHALRHKDFSIEKELLSVRLTDVKGHTMTFGERFMNERLALKRKDDSPVFELITKQQMKVEVGNSPDLVEGLMMVMPLYEANTKPIRRGFSFWFT